MQAPQHACARRARPPWHRPITAKQGRVHREKGDEVQSALAALRAAVPELAGRGGQRPITSRQGRDASHVPERAPAAYAPPLVSSPGATGSTRCVYAMCASLATVWLRPRSRNLVVSRPSTPTGPRAWMRAVLMPT